MSSLTDYFSSLATKIRSKTGKSGTLTPTQMVTEVDAVYAKGYADATPVTQTKSAVPRNSDQTITPDSGKLLSSVSVSGVMTGFTSSNDFLVGTDKLTVSGTGYVNFSKVITSKGLWLVSGYNGAIASMPSATDIENIRFAVKYSTDNGSTYSSPVLTMLLKVKNVSAVPQIRIRMLGTASPTIITSAPECKLMCFKICDL